MGGGKLEWEGGEVKYLRYIAFTIVCTLAWLLGGYDDEDDERDYEDWVGGHGR